MTKCPGSPSKVFAKRPGPLTPIERTFIEQFVADQPRQITEDQINTLAKLMRRTPTTVRRVIEAAREKFVRQACRYVDIHLTVTFTGAAASGFVVRSCLRGPGSARRRSGRSSFVPV